MRISYLMSDVCCSELGLHRSRARSSSTLQWSAWPPDPMRSSTAPPMLGKRICAARRSTSSHCCSHRWQAKADAHPHDRVVGVAAPLDAAPSRRLQCEIDDAALHMEIGRAHV